MINREFEILKQEELETTVFYARDVGWYICIRECENGFEYVFYDESFKEYENGVYDEDEIQMEDAIEEILSAEGLDLDKCNQIDFAEFLAKYNYYKVDSYCGMLDELSKRKTRGISDMNLFSISQDALSNRNDLRFSEIEEYVFNYVSKILKKFGLEYSVKVHLVRAFEKNAFINDPDIEVLLVYDGKLSEDRFAKLLKINQFEYNDYTIGIIPVKNRGWYDK